LCLLCLLILPPLPPLPLRPPLLQLLLPPLPQLPLQRQLPLPQLLPLLQQPPQIQQPTLLTKQPAPLRVALECVSPPLFCFAQSQFFFYLKDSEYYLQASRPDDKQVQGYVTQGPSWQAGSPLPFARQPQTSASVEERDELDERDTRASPPLPPAFIVAEPLVIDPLFSTSSTGGDGGGGGGGWVGGVVALVLIVLGIIAVSIAIIILLGFIAWKNKDQIRERWNTIRFPSFSIGRRNFAQFTDEEL